MSTLKGLLNEMSKSNGAKFIGIEYTNKQNETSRYVVLVGIKYENWVAKKLTALQSLTENDLKSVELTVKDKTTKVVEFSEVVKAKDELIKSLIDNQNKETASNQSKAQNDSYIGLESGARMHLDTKTIQVYGLLISKTVLIKGEPKKAVNSGVKTIAKKEIQKYLNFSNFVTFNIENEDTIINMTGNTFTNL